MQDGKCRYSSEECDEDGDNNKEERSSSFVNTKQTGVEENTALSECIKYMRC